MLETAEEPEGDERESPHDGGEGQDSADYSAFTSDLVVQLGAGGLVGVESITGGRGGDTLAGPEGGGRWVINDLDYDRAKQLIDTTIVDESPKRDWKCRKCGEMNEGQFAACWNCGSGHAAGE